MTSRNYYVYILTNVTNNVLYIGVTNDIIKRVYQHKEGIGSVFTMRYKLTKLVYIEQYSSSLEAIAREKQLKAGSRAKKIALIEAENPEYRDLFEQLL